MQKELFNSDMLRIARQSRRLSQTALAKHIHISQGKLSKIEGGLLSPSDEIIHSLATALGYKPNFFFQQFSLGSSSLTFHRKKQALSVKDLDSINARADIFRGTIKKMLSSVIIEPSFPPIPEIHLDKNTTVENIAGQLRRSWKVPHGPISDLTRLIEGSGAIIISFDFGTRLIDGFSQPLNAEFPSLIFVNTGQPKDRLRFTLAHEIGHLIMHRLPGQQEHDLEKQANQFAAAFLMPREDIISDFEGTMSLKKLMSLKVRWKTSMSSSLYRAKALGKVSESAYKYYVMEMKRRGYWTHEPVEILEEIEKPSTLQSLVNLAMEDFSHDIDKLSNFLGLEKEEVEKMYSLKKKRPTRRVKV